MVWWKLQTKHVYGMCTIDVRRLQKKRHNAEVEIRFVICHVQTSLILAGWTSSVDPVKL